MKITLAVPLTAGTASLVANIGGWMISGNQSLQQLQSDVTLLRKDIEYQARINNDKFIALDTKIKGVKSCGLQ